MRPWIINCCHSETCLLQCAPVVFFTPVGVVNGDLAARSGHDSCGDVPALKRLSCRVAETAECMPERHWADRHHDKRTAMAQDTRNLPAHFVHRSYRSYLNKNSQAYR